MRVIWEEKGEGEEEEEEEEGGEEEGEEKEEGGGGFPTATQIEGTPTSTSTSFLS